MLNRMLYAGNLVLMNKSVKRPLNKFMKLMEDFLELRFVR